MASPLYLYVHVPFCVRKCPYCDFNSHAVDGTPPHDAYVDALLRDLNFAVDAIPPRPLEGIFLGGGTPSLLPAAAVGRLLAAVNARLPIAAGAEISLEANPGTAEQGRFRGYRAVGVNRLSLGIQSFDDTLLQRLGRIHGADQAVQAVHAARGAGFDNINLDLMFALPGQTPQQALRDVQQACRLEPEHISYYQLTLEPATAFFHHPPALPDDDQTWDIQAQGQRLLADHGYQQYEVSAYAQPGRRCRHNLNYWRFGDYLGIGAGAHGKVSDGAHGAIVREARVRLPRRYMQWAGEARVIAEKRTVEPCERRLEYAMNAFRLREGFRREDFARATGLPASALEEPLQQARRLQLLDDDPLRVRASELGWRHLNTLIEQFM